MSKAAFGFLMVLIAGCFLVMVGVMGSIFGECPRPVVQFPMAQLHCSALTSCTFVGLLLMLVGGIGTSVAVIYHEIRPGQSDWA